MRADLGAGHRPWPAPARPWVMFQRWHDLLFAHWRVSRERLRARVPPALDLDTFAGEAWLGVVPFRMSGIRLRGLPPLPWASAFPELNVRTYVVVDGKPGVFFFSLDATNPLAVWVARRFYHLPYFRAHIACVAAGDGIRYESRRTHAGAPAAELVCRYEPAGDPFEAPPDSVERWLTERYCLYALDRSGRLRRGEILHERWTLQRAEATFERNSMASCLDIELASAPALLHFARRLDVVLWSLEGV